jgi:hypothetical protein
MDQKPGFSPKILLTIQDFCKNPVSSTLELDYLARIPAY